MILRNLLRPRQDSPQRIVFIGDSITQFWSSADPRWFRRDWLNKGVAGDTTAQMLARFVQDVIQQCPSVVHIMGGTNDLWHGSPGPAAAASIANVDTMIELAGAHRIAVVLAAPPPVTRQAEGLFARADLFPLLRDGIRTAALRSGVIHVDYARSLAPDGEMSRRYTTDGIHLSAAGYRAMRRQAATSLRQAGERLDRI